MDLAEIVLTEEALWGAWQESSFFLVVWISMLEWKGKSKQCVQTRVVFDALSHLDKSKHCVKLFVVLLCMYIRIKVEL